MRGAVRASAVTLPGGLRILASLLESRTGQCLPQNRLWRIETALRPIVRELQIADIDALAARLVRNEEPVLTARVIEALLNNESFFFRDSAVFALLGTDGLERLRLGNSSQRRLRIWSAGCSTGQEPYSIAMMLRDDAQRWAGWELEIVATDISAAAVAKARSGRYTQFEVQRGLPVRTMLRYFAQSETGWTVDASIRRMVRFGVHNLLSPPPGRFDLILCRNVMMYFAQPARQTAYDRLAEALLPGGILILGAGETVLGQTERFRSDPGLRGAYRASDGGEAQPRARRA